MDGESLQQVTSVPQGPVVSMAAASQLGATSRVLNYNPTRVINNYCTFMTDMTLHEQNELKAQMDAERGMYEDKGKKGGGEARSRGCTTGGFGDMTLNFWIHVCFNGLKKIQKRLLFLLILFNLAFFKICILFSRTIIFYGQR